MPSQRVADSLTAEINRLRELGKLPERTAGASPTPPAARPLRVTDGFGNPDCPLCRGLGWLRGEAFGKLEVCDCAQAKLKAAETAKLQATTGMDEADLALTWGGLYRTPGTADGVTAVRETLMRNWGWVYLHGEPGPGKTVLLKTAIAETVRGGDGAVFVTWPDLLNHMRQGYKDGSFDVRVEAWRTVPVLAVDEFGRAKESEWTAEAQVLIFNHRYESALLKKTVTLFGSNFAADSEKVDDWFYDRLRDGRFHIVHVAGPSLRPAMRES